MGKEHRFLLIGCDNNGIHTEAFVLCEKMSDAVVAFALKDAGPIKFMDVANLLLDTGEINSGDLALFEAAKETNKITIDEINRYLALVRQVSGRIIDLASGVFNFGQFAEGKDYDGRKHNNYVDGDSVSEWKIYDCGGGPAGEAITIYPLSANNVIDATQKQFQAKTA